MRDDRSQDAEEAKISKYKERYESSIMTIQFNGKDIASLQRGHRKGRDSCFYSITRTFVPDIS